MHDRAIPVFVAVLVAGATLLVGCNGSSDRGDIEESTSDPVYDSVRAAALGADENGMRRYVVALLTVGPNRTQDSARATEIQQAHMENIRRLAEANKLIIAGPFLDEGPLRGIFIFNVESVESARRLTESDPAIQAGRLAVDLHPWYGTAALQEVPDIHRQIARSP